MANLSTATGKIEFSSKNKELVEILYNSLANMQGEYATSLNGEFDKSKIEKYEDRYLFTTSFDATGRWTYLNNISNYPYWVQLNEDDKMKMEQNEWIIAYDFVDEEIGCCVLYEAVIEVKHESNTDIHELHSVEDIIDHEYSWVNIVKLGFYESISDYVDNYYYVDDEGDAEWFMDAFDENKDDIAEYLGCEKDDMKSILRLSGLEEIYTRAKNFLED